MRRVFFGGKVIAANIVIRRVIILEGGAVELVCSCPAARRFLEVVLSVGADAGTGTASGVAGITCGLALVLDAGADAGAVTGTGTASGVACITCTLA